MADIFGEVISKLKNGTEIIFTTKNVADGDDFLILYPNRPCACTFKRSPWGVWYVYFDGDEPMLLEDCPESFYRSILKNIK